MFGNRWYDEHPKVSLAVACIEKADNKLKDKLARLIIKNSLTMGVTAKKPDIGFFRRWYDMNKNLSLSMEYFKNCDNKQRIEIAEHIIDYSREYMRLQNKKEQSL